jgi:hypothetical protein
MDRFVATEFNTINETAVIAADQPIAGSGRNLLKFTLHNNLDTNNQVYAYVTGLIIQSDNMLGVLKRGSTWLRPAANPYPAPPIKITDDSIRFPLGPKGSSIDIVIPDYVASARVYVAEGEISLSGVMGADNRLGLTTPDYGNPSDPNANTNWGFFEFTLNPDGNLWCNPSFVDFVGLPMGVKVSYKNGKVDTVPGLQPNAINNICSELNDQSNRDGQPWRDMCMKGSNGKPLRILSPNRYVRTNNPMSNYYTDYVNQVWNKYRNEDLILHVANSEVRCRVNGDVMNCNGDPHPWYKPAMVDIWGCNDGAFNKISDDLHESIRPILCAAFTRTTLLINGGNVQPGPASNTYYQQNPTNHYARLVHKYEIGSSGYAFSFDDVHPGNEAGVEGEMIGQASVVELYVGGGL